MTLEVVTFSEVISLTFFGPTKAAGKSLQNKAVSPTLF